MRLSHLAPKKYPISFRPENFLSGFFASVLLIIFFLVSPCFLLAEITPPEKYLGFQPGQDFKLANWGQITDYFRLLDEASDRVKVLELGKTTLNRPLIMAIISAEENMAGLENTGKSRNDCTTPPAQPGGESFSHKRR